jgi:predicted Zn finger-like uncharacterized protein
MTEEKYTRCPGCKTVFRVTDAQLALRDGMVRCGHCQTIFDGRAQMISLAPQPMPDDEMVDEAMLGPPTVTLRSSRALEPAPSTLQKPRTQPAPSVAGSSTSTAAAARAQGPAPHVAGHAREPHFDDAALAGDSLVADDAPDTVTPEVDYEHRFAWDKPRDSKPRRTWPYAVAIPLLLILLVGQALYHFRDVIAARWPATQPALKTACASLGCTVRPLRDVSALSIDASDLQVDPAHKGLLILTATVRNRGAYALAYPYLELTLTDAQDEIVVRRAFAPGDYLGGTVDLAAGIAGNAEVALKLFIDASATQQAGYRLYLFYP